MIEAIASSGNYVLARKMLDASVLRQEAIAANIANAETPGYRRVDVAPDFATALRQQFQVGRPVDADALTALQPTLAEDATARSVRPDGNSVELEGELLNMSKNSVDYDFLTQIVSGHIKTLRMAITGRSG